MEPVLAQAARVGARAVEVWRSLTEPSASITDPLLQWRARLLASLMLAGGPLALLLSGGFLSIDPELSLLPWWMVSVVPVLGCLVTYVLARTRHWRLGAWLATTLVIAVVTVEMVLRGEPDLALFVGVAITFGGMVLRKRDTLLLAGLALGSFLTSPLWAGASFSAIDRLVVVGFYLALALVLGIGLGLRETIERERLDALTKSQARYKGLLEVAFEGLVELRDDCIVELNPGFVEITGRTESELLGRELTAVLTFESSSQAADRRASGTTSTFRQRPGTREASGKRPTGEVFYVELVSRTLATERGPVDYVAVRDITARRQAALQLSIAHRAVALGTLSAGIAHEINNPLSWMMTNLQTAQDELRHGGQGGRHGVEQDGRRLVSPSAASTESLLHTLDDALQGGRRVMSIVRDLKTMSREGSETGIADAHAALDLACRIANRQIEAKARLVRDYGHVPAVRGSAARLGQVFLNLLTNAVQAIPEGQRDVHRITLRTRSRSDIDMVEVIVRDTGRGIPPHVLPHIFDPFYTTKTKDGTGLGLSITRSVIDGMGGTIEVESREGEGATFILRLPVAERPAAAVEGPAAASAEPTSSERISSERNGAAREIEAPRASLTRISAPVASVGPTEPRIRVLIIDDEPLLGKSLRRALAEHDVTFTEDPVRALELCSETDYDAIVCDLMMPMISGEGVYEQLRERAPDLAARMIFMTGGAFTEGAQRFLREITNPVLTKPFAPNDLRAAVRRMLDTKPEPPQPPASTDEDGATSSAKTDASA
jgi:two-component system cell cycle sensor histidine kinase/response regulator CckA